MPKLQNNIFLPFTLSVYNWVLFLSFSERWYLWHHRTWNVDLQNNFRCEFLLFLCFCSSKGHDLKFQERKLKCQQMLKMEINQVQKERKRERGGREKKREGERERREREREKYVWYLSCVYERKRNICVRLFKREWERECVCLYESERDKRVPRFVSMCKCVCIIVFKYV